MGKLQTMAGGWVNAKEAAVFAGDAPRKLGWSQILGGCWRTPERDLLCAGIEEQRAEWRSAPGIALAVIRREPNRAPSVLAKFQVRQTELTVLAVLVELARDPTRRPPADVTPGVAAVTEGAL